MNLHDRVIATWLYCEQRFLSRVWIGQIYTTPRNESLTTVSVIQPLRFESDPISETLEVVRLR